MSNLGRFDVALVLYFMMPGRDRLSGRAAQPPVPNVTTSSDRRPSADSRPSSAARSATSALGIGRAPLELRAARAQAALAADVQQAAFRAQGQRAAGLAIALQAQHVAAHRIDRRQRGGGVAPAQFGQWPGGQAAAQRQRLPRVPACLAAPACSRASPAPTARRPARAATAPTAWRRSSRGSAAAGLAARDGAVPFPACANAIALQACGRRRAPGGPSAIQALPFQMVPPASARLTMPPCGAASSSQRAGSGQRRQQRGDGTGQGQEEAAPGRAGQDHQDACPAAGASVTRPLTRPGSGRPWGLAARSSSAPATVRPQSRLAPSSQFISTDDGA